MLRTRVRPRRGRHCRSARSSDMAMPQVPALALAAAFAARFPRSRQQFERAVAAIPAGVTHDSRHFTPYPIYVDRAHAARKWSIDEPELIDYWVGHGAL